MTRRDFDAVAGCLASSAHLRALVPPGAFELEGARAVADRFSSWFGGTDDFEMLDASVAEIGAKHYLRWRIRMSPLVLPPSDAWQSSTST